MAPKVPLSISHPALSAEADGWDPSAVTFGSGLKKPWKCQQGHSWIAAIGDRALGTKCPFCTGRKILIGFNDLETTHPDLSKEAHGWNPREVSSGSNKRVEWICSLGHIWVTDVAHRALGKTGCPFCKNLRLLVGFNDLETKFPSIAAEADGWDPSTIVFGTDKRRAWMCKSGHKWSTTVVSRTRDGHGCAQCGGQRVTPGVNDLATTHPEVASTAYGWDASKVMAGSSTKRLQWQCGLGHVYRKSISNRALRGEGCPICSGRKVLAGFNDLTTTHPGLAREACGWDPTTISYGSNRKLMWQCDQGHEWLATPNTRTGKLQAGCPGCAKFGYNPTIPGYLYLLRHETWGYLQIGITNRPDRRVARHETRGWTTLEIRGPMDGYFAHECEQAILDYIHKTLHAEGLIRGHKFDGFTESWSERMLSVGSIRELLDLADSN